MTYNTFFLTIGILILINLFEQIFRYWRKRLRPDLKKLYFITKSNVESRGKGHLTSKSNLLNWQKDFSTWKSTSAVVHTAITTLKSVSAVVHIAVTTLKSVFAAVQKYFSTLNSVSAVVQKYFSGRKAFQQPCKKTFQHGKVFLQQFGYMIRTWNSIYVAPHIYNAASKSVSAALFLYTKTTIRNAPFLQRYLATSMRFMYNRKQHVYS